MSNYISNFQKKIRIRAAKESKLRRLIDRGADEAKLLAAAMIVKEAWIRELRAKRARISPADTPERDEKLAMIDGRIQKAQSATPESILARFRAS